MTRVDLDQLGHLADVAAATQPPDGLTANLARRTHELVAELRAAREVVEAARLVMMPTPAKPWGHRLMALGEALGDYNEAVGS